MAGRNAREMLRLVADVRRFVLAGTRQTMRWIHQGTVRQFGRSPGTPVDTGEARSGGRVALNTPPTYQPPPDLPFYALPGDDHLDQALSRLKIGDVIHWRNRVGHAGVLEGGRRYSKKLGRMVGSKQAPKGFLNLSMAEARSRLRGWKFRPGVNG